MLYVLIVVMGINIIGSGTYDSAKECNEAAEEAVGNIAGEADAICVDVKHYKIVGIVGRSD